MSRRHRERVVAVEVGRRARACGGAGTGDGRAVDRCEGDRIRHRPRDRPRARVEREVLSWATTWPHNDGEGFRREASRDAVIW